MERRGDRLARGDAGCPLGLGRTSRRLPALAGGEGLPRSLLEAASCGRACLTTDVPGCRALVRDGIEGLLVPPGDASALAEALTRLAADPALVARMAEAARARIETGGFTEAAVTDATCRLWRDLLDE